MPTEVRDLMRDMSWVNSLWGAPRLVGELRKLGIAVAKLPLEKYWVWLTKPPAPTWKECLKNPMQDLVAIDCFPVPTVTCTVLCVLVILAPARRRILHCHVTEYPTAAWTAQ